MNDRGGSMLTVSSVLVALLTMIGLGNLPARRPNPTATPAQQAAAEAPDAAKGESSRRPGDLGPLESQLRSLETEPKDLLPVLEPLIRFDLNRLSLLKEPTEKRVLDELLTCREGDDLEFLILMVPHPTRSGLAYRFDNSMLALQLAMRQAGFVLDSHRIPWHPPSSGWERPLQARRQIKLSERPLGIEANWSIDAGEDTSGQPGMVLFRSYRRDNKSGHSLRAVLLVSNTPITGVDGGMLVQALEIARRRAEMKWQARGPNRPSRIDPIRIVGPDFSGTPSSIGRALETWIGKLKPCQLDVMDRPAVHFVTGTAQNVVRIEPRLPSAARVAPAAGGQMGDRPITLVEATIHKGDDYLGELIRFIDGHFSTGQHIAILSEESSRFGAADPLRIPSSPPCHVVQFTFPLGIAELRRRYEDTAAGGPPESELRTAERLRLAVSERTDVGELIRQESPGVSVPGDELRMVQVVREIDRLDIGHVIIQASDVRDTAFLIDFLKSRNPNLRFYSVAPDLALTQQAEMRHFRGLVTAATYPNLLAAQGWTIPLPQDQAAWARDEDAQVWKRIALPNHAAYGVYNATLAQLINLETDGERKKEVARQLVGFGNPAAIGERRTPPIWLVAASQQGFIPLSVRDAESPERLWNSNIPFAAREGAQRLDPAKAKGWILVFAIVSFGLAALSVAYLARYIVSFIFGREPQRRWESSSSLRAPPGAGAWKADRRGSFLLDDLGLAGLHRRPEGSGPSDRRRREVHLFFFATALFGYATLAIPAWGVAWGQTRWPGAFLSVVFWLTWTALVVAGIAALDAARSRWSWLRQLAPPAGQWSRSAPRHHPARSRVSEDDQDRKSGHGDPPIRNRGLYLLLFEVAGAITLALSVAALLGFRRRFLLPEPSADDGATPFLAKLFGVRATALTSGISPLMPLLVGLTALAFLTVNRLREIWVVRPYDQAWWGVPIPRGLAMGLDFFADSLRRLHEDGQANAFGFRRRPVMTAVALGTIVAVGYWLFWAWGRYGIAVLEPRAVEAVLSLGFLGLFASLVSLLQMLSGLWLALEEMSELAAALPFGRAFGRLPRSVASRFGNFLRAIQRPLEDMDEAQPHVNNILLEPIHQQQADALKYALVRARRAIDYEWPDDAAGSPVLDAARLDELEAELDRPPAERSGARTAQACCRMLAPFWCARPAARACDPPPTDSKSRERASSESELCELDAYKDDDQSTVRRLLEEAETFVAMETARELNRFLAAFWLRVTAVTVLALLMLIYVSSYPFGPMGQMLGIAVGTVAVTVVVVIRVIWSFHINPFLAAVSGRKDTSAFSREMVGRLLTFALPLLIGLGAMLSLTASELIRALLGQWF